MNDGILVIFLAAKDVVDLDQSKQYLTTHTIDDGKATL